MMLLEPARWSCSAAKVSAAQRVEISDLGAAGLNLAPCLYGKDQVIILDAVNTEGKRGTVRTYAESDFLGCQAQI